jgi:cytochrome c peroxidase
MKLPLILFLVACDEAVLPPPLSSVEIPKPADSEIVDEEAAVLLGKALFWDVQAGSDALTSCASCHFAAGADDRREAIHPGPDRAFGTRDDRVGSFGVVRRVFSSIGPGEESDRCVEEEDPLFGSERQVTKRNTPTVIGSVFFAESPWDGRKPTLAKQAEGPIEDDVEMACDGRPLAGANSVGARLVDAIPLGLQEVSRDDGVLAGLCEACTYRDLIRDAFGEALALRAEEEFARIWGQAIHAYEATLISEHTPFDRMLAGDLGALTPRQQGGLETFLDECTVCHAGPELSDATPGFRALHGEINEDGGDQGYHNLGVAPTEEDLGRGDFGADGVSFSKSGKDRGAFKTPSLRNVKLTAPYFHDGSKATLRDVIEFYDDGGDFENEEQASEVGGIDVDGGDADALADFLENALTDCRVEMEQAPFDHPSLPLPDGRVIPAIGRHGRGPCPE